MCEMLPVAFLALPLSHNKPRGPIRASFVTMCCFSSVLYVKFISAEDSK